MDDLLKLFTDLFTPAQQTALFVITLGVMGLVQVFKNVYFGFHPVTNRNKKKAILWLVAFTFGVLGGVAGYFVGKPPQPLWFWMFTGAISGCAALGVFKFVVDVLWPRIKRDS